MSESQFPDRGAAPPTPVAGGASIAWEREVLEKLVMATLQEQRAARRWKIAFRLMILAVVVMAVWGTLGVEESKTIGRHTALVSLEGEIAGDTIASAETINAALQSAFKDDSTAGVILRINSPGGSPVQAGMINDEIRRLRALYPNKPIYAVVEEVCASGGYYVAVAADKIYVDKASIVGSIGVLMDGFGFTGLMDKLGIERRLYTAGENKAMLDPFSPLNPKHQEYAQTMLNQIHNQFIQVVKEGRGDRLQNNPEIFSGLFWSGQQSVALGLADATGTVDSVARDVIKAEDILDYTVKENLAERVARRLGAAVGGAATKAMLLASQPGLR